MNGKTIVEITTPNDIKIKYDGSNENVTLALFVAVVAILCLAFTKFALISRK